MANYFIPKVWHAFQSLKDSSNPGYASRSKLKVLNQNLGSVIQLDFQKPYEEVFPEEEFKHKPGVSFEEYESFLICHVLAKLPHLADKSTDDSFNSNLADKLGVPGAGAEGQASPSTVRKSMRNSRRKGDILEEVHFFYNGSRTNIDWDKLDDVCWLLYKKFAFPKPPPGLTGTTLFLLWKLFITYSKTTNNAGVISVPVVMDADELEYWLGKFSEFFAKEFIRRGSTTGEVPEFLKFEDVIDQVVELTERLNLTANDVEMAFMELTDEALNGVIRKGYLIKKGKKECKNMWCVMTANNFAFYSEEDKTEKRGQIQIKSNFVLESPSVKGDRGTKFQITSDDGIYVFEAADLRSKNSWIQDFQAAIRYQSEGISNWSIHEGQKRQERRESARDKKRMDLEERDRELKMTMKAKEELEKRLQDEQLSLEKQRERIQELEEMQESLQKVLEEEKQARADEEVVRKLQAKLLEEEKEARNKMNLLIREKETLLSSEMSKRSDVENLLSTEKAKMDQILYEKGQLTVKLEEEQKLQENNDSQFKHLHSDLQRTKEELSSLKQEILENTSNFIREKEEMSTEFDQQIEQYRNQIEELMDLNTNLKEESKWLKLEILRLSSELEKEQSMKNQLESKLTNSQNSFKTLEEKHQATISEKETLKSEFGIARQDQIKELNEKKKELDAEKESRKKLEEDKMNQEIYMFNEIDKRAQMEIEVSSHKTRADRLSKENIDLREKLETTLKQLNKSNSKLKELSEKMNESVEIEEPLSMEEEEVSPNESASPPEEVPPETTSPPPPQPTGWAARLFGNKK